VGVLVVRVVILSPKIVVVGDLMDAFIRQNRPMNHGLLDVIGTISNGMHGETAVVWNIPEGSGGSATGHIIRLVEKLKLNVVDVITIHF